MVTFAADCLPAGVTPRPNFGTLKPEAGPEVSINKVPVPFEFFNTTSVAPLPPFKFIGNCRLDVPNTASPVTGSESTENRLVLVPPKVIEATSFTDDVLAPSTKSLLTVVIFGWAAVCKVPVTSPVTLPVTSPVTSPVTLPVTSPVTSPVRLPVTLPVTSPVTLPVTSPVTSPVRLPVTLPVTSPVRSPVTSPVTSPVRLPVTSPVTSPVRLPVTSPVTPC